MTWSDIFSPLIGVVRLILSIFKKDSNHHSKRLQARLVMRGRIAELPDDIPFYLCDENGVRYKGVYVIGLLIWNKGNQAIIASDFLTTLEVKIGEDATLIGSRLIAVEEATNCSTTLVSPNRLSIGFDCINPNEYLVVPIFITGNPWVEVNISGRIIGQAEPIDHTAEEVRASGTERVACLFMLILVLNMIPGLLVGGWFIWRDYGLSALWKYNDNVPYYLELPYSAGLMMLLLFIASRIFYWIEKRHYPADYPLSGDFEPSLLENIYGMLRTVFLGKKQRISMSIFDRGEPVLMPDRKVKKRSVNDWIQ
ncbi:hypothetical protein VXS72_11000 [Acinetobacter pittii]|uniref:hypothetical protein n=1 Tax=Acinetobacter pittii TaxID=48296 RepID=UPI002E18F3B5|nr:hypothetical protein [Acinetobacter pittii]